LTTLHRAKSTQDFFQNVVPDFLSALETCSRQDAIQIYVYICHYLYKIMTRKFTKKISYTLFYAT